MEKITQKEQSEVYKTENSVQIIEKIAVQDKDIQVNEYSFNNMKVKDYYMQDAEEDVENEKFFSSEEFHDNMTRGLSVIEDAENNTKIFQRRGHRKFDDLGKEKIKLWLSKLVDQNFINKKFKETAENVEKEITENDKKLILKNHPVNFEYYSTIFIYRTFKDDGACSQISFCKNAQAWVVCTKNESLIFKQKSDALKADKRYKYIITMGLLWFEYLDSLDNQLREEVCQYFSDKTLLSELCGGMCKYYVKYDSNPVLISFSIVKNQPGDICISPEEAEAIFKKFKLRYRQIQKTVECDNYRDFYKLYKQIYIEVNNYSFLEKGEGEVLYICGRPRLSPEQIKVIKMVKLKTIEYKILKEGEQFVSKLNYVNNEISQSIIKDFIHILQNLPKFKGLKLSKVYLPATIRLMKNQKIDINPENIKNFIIKQFGEQKLKTLQS
ncbi:hypothetical protein TTHERM_00263420 (macronuclear) [Tetrahymena thermophila SB210]|uniref:Uncharacterized protein n=1 Tax=Tetrahymena thermophila (strain SB210) TaxID=312017 RepID=Q22U41_TETTS|nr:hypothetical protein TTHERM_00263420 [Tetrahymena thermophila SB210]EAR88846.1 hypothetical protein TTHERM_00263420 [Tetrahymena thermophila SB210]|eukprot:XP_001009091.1 hypothetical protein TTHERM_00263420 [Tetrahymena thermophila SB210]